MTERGRALSAACFQRRVAPGRLLQSGFVFEYPVWDAAARDLYQRWIALQGR